MKRKYELVALCLLILVLSTFMSAQVNNSKSFVTIQMTPDKADWTYKVGEEVTLKVSVVCEYVSLEGIGVKYKWINDMIPKAISSSRIVTMKGPVELKLPGKETPGFRTLQATAKVNGVEYSNYITVGFDPYDIVTTTEMPKDFVEFWKETIDKALELPLEPIMTLQPELCTSDADVYHISFLNDKIGSRMYGMISLPKKEGVYPAILKLPGAGIRKFSGNTSYSKEGIIYLEIGIHGIPVNYPLDVYNSLNTPLSAYFLYQNDDRDNYYYKRVITGCYKAIEFLKNMSQVDKGRIGTCGSSQGGALSIITAALNKGVKCVNADFPALCQIGGFYKGTTGGWPRLFKNMNKSMNVDQKIKVLEYYDVVNFARLLDCPGFYACGYNDQVCPPTATFAAYNQIKSPKTIRLARDCAHWLYPEQSAEQRVWLINQLKN